MIDNMIRLMRCRRAATAIEYGLILALVVIGIIASMSLLGSNTRGVWTNMATKVSNVTPTA